MDCRVEGKKCASCKPGSFGLSAANVEEGCTACFCFGRTKTCSEAVNYYWTQIGHYGGGSLTVTHSFLQGPMSPRQPIVPLGRDVTIRVGFLFRENSSTSKSKALLTSFLQAPSRLESPVYWKLPSKFGGDRILSYNGFLRYGLRTTHN